MKKFCFLLFVFSWVLSGLFAIEITFAFEDKEQPPYYMGNTTEVLAQPGVSVEMAKLLEEYIPDLKVTFKRVPWKRCLHELQNGNVDGIFNASFSESRLEMGAYPMKEGEVDTEKRLTTIAYYLYTSKHNPVTFDGKRIGNADRPVGAPRGYSIINDLQKIGVEVEEANTTQQNLMKVVVNRISAAALQDVTADSEIKKNPSEFAGIVKVEPPLKVKPYYLMLSHQFVEQHPELAKQIWDTIEKIREERSAEIIDKY